MRQTDCELERIGLGVGGDPRRGAVAIPGTIFASWKSAHSGSQRPLQTVAPLARRLAITPRTLKKDELTEGAAAAQACEGTAQTCWQHEDIPAIAALIPGDRRSVRTSWPGDRFDVAWVFDLDPASMSYEFSQVALQLLDGDRPVTIAVPATPA
jgi:hypothetical protein